MIAAVWRSLSEVCSLEDRELKIGKVQIILRPGSKLLKVLVVVLVVFSTAALAALWWVRTDVTRQTETLRAQAAALEYENEDLQSKIDELGSMAGIARIAKEELGLVSPDTVLITPHLSK